MSHIALQCMRCGAHHAADMLTLACRDCGAPLEVAYLDEDRSGSDTPLPLHAPGSTVSLGEGNTPCIQLPTVGARLGLRRLLGKLEFLNPTGSFKDRGTAVMVAVAREQGVAEIVEDSSGNAGASVSAYAARAGIKTHIFVPASAPDAKLRQIRAYGARVCSVEGSRSATTEAAVAFHRDRGLVYASHAMSPYFLEGTKSFAYELAQQLGEEERVPDHMVFPVGNGSLFIGAWKGFVEMRDRGRIQRVPRLHCVQARAVMPIVAAYNHEKWSPDSAASTVAGGIAVAAPPRLQRVLDILSATGGVAVAVDDPDILRWHEILAEEEGVFAEPTSAAALAGLERLVGGGVIGPDNTVLVPITGSGLKDAPPA